MSANPIARILYNAHQMNELLQIYHEPRRPGEEVFAGIAEMTRQQVANWKEELPNHTQETPQPGRVRYSASAAEPRTGVVQREMTVQQLNRRIVTQTRQNRFNFWTPEDARQSTLREVLRGKETNVVPDAHAATTAGNPAESLVETSLSLSFDQMREYILKKTTHHLRFPENSRKVGTLEQTISFDRHFFYSKYWLMLFTTSGDIEHVDDNLLFEVKTNYDVSSLQLSSCKIEVFHVLQGVRAKQEYSFTPSSDDLTAGFVDYGATEAYGSLPAGNSLPTVLEHKPGYLSARAELLYAGVRATIPIQLQLQFTPAQLLNINDGHMDPKIILRSDQ